MELQNIIKFYMSKKECVVSKKQDFKIARHSPKQAFSMKEKKIMLRHHTYKTVY